MRYLDTNSSVGGGGFNNGCVVWRIRGNLSVYYMSCPNKREKTAPEYEYGWERGVIPRRKNDSLSFTWAFPVLCVDELEVLRRVIIRTRPRTCTALLLMCSGAEANEGNDHYHCDTRSALSLPSGDFGLGSMARMNP